jgi:hypothetical protein
MEILPFAKNMDNNDYNRQISSYVNMPGQSAGDNINIITRCDKVVPGLGATHLLLLLLLKPVSEFLLTFCQLFSNFLSIFTRCDVVGTWSREYQLSSSSSSSSYHSLFYDCTMGLNTFFLLLHHRTFSTIAPLLFCFYQVK